MSADSTSSQRSLGADSGDSATLAPSKAPPLCIQQVREAQRVDHRSQPWKEALGNTHDKGEEGEDLINLKLPNHVQCGSMAV